MTLDIMSIGLAVKFVHVSHAVEINQVNTSQCLDSLVIPY